MLGLPLTSTAGLTHAAGLAIGGARPLVLMPSVAALVEGLAALRETTRFSKRYDTERALQRLPAALCFCLVLLSSSFILFLLIQTTR